MTDSERGIINVLNDNLYRSFIFRCLKTDTIHFVSKRLFSEWVYDRSKKYDWKSYNNYVYPYASGTEPLNVFIDELYYEDKLSFDAHNCELLFVDESVRFIHHAKEEQEERLKQCEQK